MITFPLPVEDIELLLETRPELDLSTLGPVLLERGRRHEHHDEDEIDAETRELVVHLGAEIGVYRYWLLTERSRMSDAIASERATYERSMKLEMDLVPPLKFEAKRLRLRIRALEEEMRSEGIDPDQVTPHLSERRTMSVDDYRGSRFVARSDAKQAALDFFRRIR